MNESINHQKLIFIDIFKKYGYTNVHMKSNKQCSKDNIGDRNEKSKNTQYNYYGSLSNYNACYDNTIVSITAGSTRE